MTTTAPQHEREQVEVATSVLLPGFTVSVEDCFKAGDGCIATHSLPEGRG